MSVLGNSVVLAALIASLLAMIQYYRAAQGKHTKEVARRWVYASVAAVVAASVLLLVLLLQHDFSNGYVYSYSSRSLPLHFLLSSFYAGQQGSFLFWALCSALIAVAVLAFTKRRGHEAPVMAVLMAVNSFMFLFVVVKSPFVSVWELFPQIPIVHVPEDGQGLNPLLQNFWMVIHPPVLFLGFAALAVPFSFAIAGLWRKSYSLLSEHGLPWLLFATVVLGTGIMLGAYWAYGVLGWGGYWGWDPVENSSLIPWLVGVALIHTLLAQRGANKFKRTNVVLATFAFFFVIYSTFLTRSGVLGDSSVHSFADGGATIYWLLLTFMIGILSSAIGLLYVRRNELRPVASDHLYLTREAMLGNGSLAVLLSAAVILIGTSLPIFSNSSVEPSFYDATNLPIAIIMAFLIGLSIFMQWKTQDWRTSLKKAIPSFVIAVIGVVGLMLLNIREPIVLLFIGGSLFALAGNGYFAWKLGRIDIRSIGGKVAHAGIAVFFIGVIVSGKYSVTQHLTLPKDVATHALGQTMTYTGWSYDEDQKAAFRVRIEQDGKEFYMTPIMFDAGQQGTMRNPDIASFMTSDLYISPVSLDDASSSVHHEHYDIQKGKSVMIGDIEATFVRFDMGSHGQDAMASGNGAMQIGSVLQLKNHVGSETVTPTAVYEPGGTTTYKPTSSKLLGANIQLVSMHVAMDAGASMVTVEVQHSGETQHAPEALIVEASIKPWIGLVWAGTIIMTLGFLLSLLKWRRTQ